MRAAPPEPSLACTWLGSACARSACLAITVAVASNTLGCTPGGGVSGVAERNTTFYLLESKGESFRAEYERPLPRLDHPGSPERHPGVGVSVLAWHVHLSRPNDWVLRDGSAEPGRRFVRYVSPRAFVFGIYEWDGSPDEPWSAALQRLEADYKATRTEVVNGRIPMAACGGQGRGFELSRTVLGAKGPYKTASREYLVRSRDRFILVQVVVGTAEPARWATEVASVFETLTLD